MRGQQKFFSALCANLLKNPPLYLPLCDERNDNNKNFIILVRLWDDRLYKPVTRFLHMSVCNAGTSDKIFVAIDVTLEERKKP